MITMRSNQWLQDDWGCVDSTVMMSPDSETAEADTKIKEELLMSSNKQSPPVVNVTNKHSNFDHSYFLPTSNSSRDLNKPVSCQPLLAPTMIKMEPRMSPPAVRSQYALSLNPPAATLIPNTLNSPIMVPKITPSTLNCTIPTTSSPILVKPATTLLKIPTTSKVSIVLPKPQQVISIPAQTIGRTILAKGPPVNTSSIVTLSRPNIPIASSAQLIKLTQSASPKMSSATFSKIVPNYLGMTLQTQSKKTRKLLSKLSEYSFFKKMMIML